MTQQVYAVPFTVQHIGGHMLTRLSTNDINPDHFAQAGSVDFDLFL